MIQQKRPCNRWKVFRTLWRLQLTLLDESTQKQVAVLDLNGTTFGSYWKPSDDSVSIRGDKEDKAWLGVVIATGMAVAKYEKQRFKSQLGSEKANCKDDMYEPKRFSMEMYRASSLRSALST